MKIARMTLTIKLDGNGRSFHLPNSAPPLSITARANAPFDMEAPGGQKPGVTRNGWAVSWTSVTYGYQCSFVIPQLRALNEGTSHMPQAIAMWF